MPRERYAGTSVMFFALTNLVKIAPYVAMGLLSPPNLLKSASLAPLAFASTVAGILVVRRTAERRFYGLVTEILVMVGAKLVCDGTALIWV